MAPKGRILKANFQQIKFAGWDGILPTPSRTVQLNELTQFIMQICSQKFAIRFISVSHKFTKANKSFYPRCPRSFDWFDNSRSRLLAADQFELKQTAPFIRRVIPVNINK